MESYDEILTRMKEHYRELSGFAPENESDIMLRLRVLAGEVFKERAYADYIMRQMFRLQRRAVILTSTPLSVISLEKQRPRLSVRCCFLPTHRSTAI